MQTRESSARAALKAKCGHQRDCIFCSQENRKSRPSPPPVNGPGCSPRLPGVRSPNAARSWPDSSGCSYLRTLFAASVTPLLLHLAGGRSERAAGTFSLKLAARGRIRKIAVGRWLLGSVWRKRHRSIWVRIKAACRQINAPKSTSEMKEMIHSQIKISPKCGAENLQCICKVSLFFVASFLSNSKRYQHCAICLTFLFWGFMYFELKIDFIIIFFNTYQFFGNKNCP